MNGQIISLEGIECCGKGTQIRLIEQFLKSQGLKCFLTHEPGGALYSEALRVILKNPNKALPAIFKSVLGHPDYEAVKEFLLDEKMDYSRSGITEIFLFMANRAPFCEMIKPLINQGYFVLADRFMDSTTAYQGYGKMRGDPKVLKNIRRNNRFAMQGLWPYLTFFIDISVDTMYERMAKTPKWKDAYFEERYPREAFERIRAGYHKIAAAEPNRVIVIDGEPPVEEVFLQIRPYLDSLRSLSSPINRVSDNA